MADISYEAAAELEDYIREGQKRTWRFEQEIKRLKEQLRQKEEELYQYKLNRKKQLLEEEAEYRRISKMRDQIQKDPEIYPLTRESIDQSIWFNAIVATLNRAKELKSLEDIN